MGLQRDFNDIMFAHEKRGMLDRGGEQMRQFREVVQMANLKGRGEDAAIWERLDRCFVNITRQEAFSATWIQHGWSSYSNHSTIWLKLTAKSVKKGMKRKGKKPFRFATFWFHDEECKGRVMHHRVHMREKLLGELWTV